MTDYTPTTDEVRETAMFAGINDGDKIRVEWGEFAVEGLWTSREGKSGWNDCLGTIEGALGDHFGNHTTCYHLYRAPLSEPVTRVTVLRRALPPEPPKKAVVFDKWGWVWQNTGDKWGNAEGTTSCTWAELYLYGIDPASLSGDDK